MKNENIKNIIVVVVLVLVVAGIFVLVKYFLSDDSLEYEEYLKNYEINEYIAVYKNDEDMAKIYLNDYVHKMYQDTEKSYDLLDEEYRNKKFGNLENYLNYVKSLGYQSFKMAKYYKTSKDGYVIFGVYDTNGNIFVFKVKGVMNYKVYLDDYTVEI